MDNYEAFMNVMELAAGAQTAIRLPFNTSEATKTGDGKYKKEILKLGEIVVDQKGRKFNFDSKFLKELANNFNSGALDYVPLLFTDDENRHVVNGHPNSYGGVIEELSLDDPQNPTKVYGTFNLTDETKRMVDHNPKFGVSVTAHPNYVDMPRSTYYGPMLLNVAGTHYPKMTQMSGWEKVSVSASNEMMDIQILDLSDSEYITSVDVNTEKEGEVDMSEQNTGNTETLNLSALMDNDEFKNFLATQISEATKDKDTQIANLSSQVTNMQSEGYKNGVETLISSYKAAGVPPAILDNAQALLLSFEGQEATEVLTLSVPNGEDQKLNKMEVVAKMLDELKGTVNLSAETGSQEEVTENMDTGARRQAAMQLVRMAKNA